MPMVQSAILAGPRIPRQTKADRVIFNGVQGAVHHIGVEYSKVLRDSGLECCFDSFRATVFSLRHLRGLSQYIVRAVLS